MTPQQVVEEWVRRFNAADADALAELYREDATNHQVVQEPVVGKTAIREMFRREFAAAKMACVPEFIHEAGNVTILEMEGSHGAKGVRLLHGRGRPNRVSKRLLGQAVFPQDARLAN
jgi:ketosteroid isomerase-like protein